MVLVILGSYFLYTTHHLLLGLVISLTGQILVAMLMVRAKYLGLVVMQIVFALSTTASFYEKFMMP
jgi:hypothetical protein